MVPSFFTTSSFYDFFKMLSMAGISFTVKAFSREFHQADA